MSAVDAEGRCRVLEQRLSPKLAAHLRLLRECSREVYVCMAAKDGGFASVLLFPTAEAVEAPPEEDDGESWALIQEPTVLVLVEANLPDVREPPKLELVKRVDAS